MTRTSAPAATSALTESPSARQISAGRKHWTLLREIIGTAQVTGRLITGAAIVSICLEHGVDTILSTDRDFARFDSIRWQPLQDG